MDIIDAQVHGFYSLDEGQLIAVMDALGIQGLLMDELWRHTEEGYAWPYQVVGGVRRPVAPRAQAAAITHPDRFAFMQRLAWRDPQLPSLFSVLGNTPGCRGVRMNLKSKEDREALAGGGCDEVMQLAGRYDLAVCILIHGQNAPALMSKLLARFPDVRFVMDHCGNPKSAAQWTEILKLSALPNLWLKWCHAAHCFEPDEYPFRKHQDELVNAISAFGAHRILWASDITHERSGAKWGQLLHYVLDCPSISTEDKEWLLGKSARTVFKWARPEPTGASLEAGSKEDAHQPTTTA